MYKPAVSSPAATTECDKCAMAQAGLGFHVTMQLLHPAKLSTAQHSSAQLSTAQHGTAQHRMGIDASPTSPFALQPRWQMMLQAQQAVSHCLVGGIRRGVFVSNKCCCSGCHLEGTSHQLADVYHTCCVVLTMQCFCATRPLLKKSWHACQA